MILTEVLRGFRSDRDYQKVRQVLLRLHVFELAGKDIALRAASNYRQLPSAGITRRKTVDLFIGTWCITNDIPLLHMDRDFEAMRKLGLKVWQAH